MKVEVVIVAGLMASLKVATTVVIGGTLVALVAGTVLKTVGAMMSTVQVHVAGVASTLPAASMALTVKVCMAFVRREYAFGEVQMLEAAPSRLQPNVTLASGDVNVKLAEILVVKANGMVVIVVSGGVLSIVTAAIAESFVLFDVSAARAETAAAPSGTAVEFQSKLYGAELSVPTTLPLTRKSTWSTATSSVALAANVTILPMLAPLIGAVSVTLGGVVSGGVVTEAD